MKSKKARRIRLFQDLQKNSPPKWKAYFVLKFVPLDSFRVNNTFHFLQASHEILFACINIRQFIQH
jgi:hypothetical protein